MKIFLEIIKQWDWNNTIVFENTDHTLNIFIEKIKMDCTSINIFTICILCMNCNYCMHFKYNWRTILIFPNVIIYLMTNGTSIILEILRAIIFDSIETTQLVSIWFDVSISLEYWIAYKQNPVQTELSLNIFIRCIFLSCVLLMRICYP